jgi:hypothetical protein
VKTLELRYESVEALQSDAAANLAKARAFLLGEHEVAERERCELMLVRPDDGRHLTLQAEAVWCGPDGVGLELIGFGEEVRRAIDAFAESSPAEADAPEGAGVDRRPRTLQERIRSLNLRERDDVARHGSLSERVALERIFTNAVWEGLLANPQLTPPEVVRIAKNGTLPRPLVGTIVANPSWLGVPEVQRALLGNPRCGGPHLEKVLRALKPPELVRLSQSCPYRPEVKATALRLLR